MRSNSADALNFGVLFVVLDVQRGDGIDVATYATGNSQFAAKQESMLMPAGIMAPTLATAIFSTLSSERYTGCAHPLAPISTLAACQAAATDIVLGSGTHWTAGEYVIASMQEDGCHFQLTLPGWSPNASNILAANDDVPCSPLCAMNATMEQTLDTEAAYILRTQSNNSGAQQASEADKIEVKGGKPKAKSWPVFWPRRQPVNVSIGVFVMAGAQDVSSASAWQRLVCGKGRCKIAERLEDHYASPHNDRLLCVRGFGWRRCRASPARPVHAHLSAPHALT